MRIPSTSDLCHAQANKAYDKLAVISDNIEELKVIYDFIFDLKEYFRQLLKEYSIKDKDESYNGEKKFLKGLKTNKISIFNSIDILDDLAFIETGYEDHNPYLLLHIDRYIEDLQDTLKSSIKLTLDLDRNIPIFTIPPTDSETEESAVRLDYLNQVVKDLNDLINALDVRVTDLEDLIKDLGDRVSELENRTDTLEDSLIDDVEEDSSKGVKSSGIYKFVKDIEESLRSLIGTVDGKAYPICTKSQKGIVQAGTGIDVEEGVISINLDVIAQLIGGGEETGDKWRVWKVGKLALVRVPDQSSVNPNASVILTCPIKFKEVINIFNRKSSDLSLEVYGTCTVQGNQVTLTNTSQGVSDLTNFNILGWVDE